MATEWQRLSRKSQLTFPARNTPASQWIPWPRGPALETALLSLAHIRPSHLKEKPWNITTAAY